MSKQIVSLWFGQHSQQLAHHFYNLQAEQFFDEQQDPLDHQVLWKNIDNKSPRAIIFDITIQNLSRIRRVNHKKIINKMQKKSTSSEYGMYSQFGFPVNVYSPQQKQQPDSPQQIKAKKLYQNWNVSENNYIHLKDNHHYGKKDYEFWENTYNRNAENFEDKIRKQLELCNSLKGFTIVADEDRLGFTNKCLQYLLDTCPKKNIIFSGFGKANDEDIRGSLAEISQQVDMYVPIHETIPQYAYFHQANFYKNMAPLYSCIFTPLMLKSNEQLQPDYFSKIISNKQNMFNVAYTLPVILTEQQQFEETNIFRYCKTKLEKPVISEEENKQKYINFTNKNLLKFDEQNGKFISESYILKGHGFKLENYFIPKTQLLSIKYLEGIFATPEAYQTKYSSFYAKYYGEKVDCFPFHTVMFSHESFGITIRKLTEKSSKNKVELGQWEWMETIEAIADNYLSNKQQSDSD